MANVKTAISLNQSLFERADAMARRLQVSRSELFSKAMNEFLERRENRILLESINRALEDLPPDPEEELRMKGMRQRHRKLLEGKW